MTRHSTLNNADDLHYAKIRSFTGDPAAITPNFIDQILTATDTNKVYRATGLSSGALIELANTPQDPISGGGSSKWQLIEWDIYQETIQLEIDKKYIKKASGNVVAILPANPIVGSYLILRNINPNGFLYLASQEAVIRFSQNDAQNSPFDLYGNPANRQYLYIDSGVCELVFIGGGASGLEWNVISGDISYRQYTPPVFGCTDSSALNYNPLATVNDDSCEYP